MKAPLKGNFVLALYWIPYSGICFSGHSLASIATSLSNNSSLYALGVHILLKEMSHEDSQFWSAKDQDTGLQMTSVLTQLIVWICNEI